MWIPRHFRPGGLLLLLSLCALAALAAETNPADIPRLRCPKMRTAPTIDGTLAPGEWQGAAGISALVSACPAGGATPTIAPPIQQVTFYLAYDDQYLYLAMHSPHQAGTYPQARCKHNDETWGVLSEDHIEFQICKHTREQASTPGFGFYKMMVNPRGAMVDQWHLNGTVGSEELWSTGGQTKCTVTPTYWQLEMSVELAQMGLKSLDARSLIMWLVRADWCNGIYFLTWGPGFWMGWNTMPEVTFDPAAPAVQLAGVGEIMDGNPAVVFNLCDTAGTAHALTGTLKILNKAGQTVCDERATATLAANGTATLRLAKGGVPLDDDGNTVFVEVREGETVLYYTKMPLAKLTDVYRKNILDPWLKGRPQSGDWDYHFAYRPGDGVAECSADLDFFGVSESVATADACEVALLTAKDKPLVAGRFPIAGKVGSTLLKTPVLPAGDYKARFTLFAGKKKLEAKELTFVRKVFPWESERLGISDEVVPPYEPITVATDKPSGAPVLRVWNRAYFIGPNGLPARIGYSPHLSHMLRAPVRLEVDGAAAPPTPPVAKPAEVTKAAGHATTITGAQQVGPLAITTEATLEYDGWYDVTLDIAPGPAPAPVNSLDLVLDLPSDYDTLYVHRNSDAWAGSYFGAIPAGTGTVWDSTSLATFKDGLLPAKEWKSFVPVMFVGTGSRGLWFYAWSNAGWQLADGDAAVRIQRDARGNPTLRIRLLAGGLTLTQARKIRFALLAAPVKPLPDTYRNWKMAHDTAGYRYYGDSVDGYALPNDAAYEMERKRLLYGPQSPFAREWFGKRGWGVSMGREAIRHGRPVALYGSTSLTGAGMAEFDTFGGEWLGRTNWKGGVEHSAKGNPNYSGSVVWDTDRKCTVIATQFTPSYIDCFVWYHQKLIAKGVNGTFFDNCSIGLIKEYDPATGRMDTVFNQYARRQLMKRLTTLNWQQMRPPCWITNMHEDFSFSDVIWLVENDWYINGAGRTLLDHMSLDTFRAMACTKTMQQVAKPWISPGTAKDDPRYERVVRSITGVLLAHDVQNGPLDAKLRRWLNFHVDFDDGRACQFRGYWETGALVNTKDPDVKCSVYLNPGRKTAVLWLLNAGKEDKTLTGVIGSSDLFAWRKNLDCTAAFDAETGAPVPVTPAGDWEKIKAFALPAPLVVKAHGFRAIAVGAE
jgi:hypothetical protein